MTGNDEAVVIDVLDGLVNSKALFTAFDVTKLVRARLNGAECFHSDVRKIVKNYSLPIGYSMNPVHIPGFNVNPILYHPVGTTVADYSPVRGNQGPFSPNTPPASVPVQPKVSVPSTSMQVSNSVPFPLPFSVPSSVNDGLVTNLDSRGRYCVRAKDIIAAGLGAGDEVFLTVKNGEIELFSDTVFAVNATADSMLTVDKYCNLRIFQTYFTKAFGKVPSKITVTPVPGNKSIKIREV